MRMCSRLLGGGDPGSYPLCLCGVGYVGDDCALACPGPLAQPWHVRRRHGPLRPHVRHAQLWAPVPRGAPGTLLRPVMSYHL